MKRKGRVAEQFAKARPASQDKKASSAKPRKKSVVRRPWTTPQLAELSREERDIVLDRVTKEVVAPLREHRALLPFVVRGINSVAKAVERSELAVVVVANNPESLLFGHIPLACRIRNVPVCVLHLSSKTLGKLFELKSVSVFGIRRLPSSNGSAAKSQASGSSTVAGQTDDSTADNSSAATFEDLSNGLRSRLESITAFLVSKASKKANKAA